MTSEELYWADRPQLPPGMAVVVSTSILEETPEELWRWDRMRAEQRDRHRQFPWLLEVERRCDEAFLFGVNP
jgi:hypothetical protein